MSSKQTNNKSKKSKTTNNSNNNNTSNNHNFIEIEELADDHHPGNNSNNKVIPFVRGFKVPTRLQSLQAVSENNNIKDESLLPIELQPTKEFFPNIPNPDDINDWLANYPEKGQTYLQFINQTPWIGLRPVKGLSNYFDSKQATNDSSTIKERYPNTKIYLVPLGAELANNNNNNSNSNAPSLNKLREFSEIYLGLPVVCLPSIDLDDGIGENMIFSWDPNKATNDEKTNNNNSNNKGDKSSKLRDKSRRFSTSISCRKHLSSGKRQLRIDDILSNLRKVLPEDGLCLIALTMEDLYSETPDLFVAGMAAGNHRVAVFSFARYNPLLRFSGEFWWKQYQLKLINNHNHKNGKSKPNKSSKRKASSIIDEDDNDTLNLSESECNRLILLRSCRLLVHETLHLLGFDHCIHYCCLMNGSGHLKEDFKQPMFLCPIELNKLKLLTGVDLQWRYSQLLQWYQNESMNEEANWIEKRLKFIENKYLTNH